MLDIREVKITTIMTEAVVFSVNILPGPILCSQFTITSIFFRYVFTVIVAPEIRKTNRTVFCSDMNRLQYSTVEYICILMRRNQDFNVLFLLISMDTLRLSEFTNMIQCSIFHLNIRC